MDGKQIGDVVIRNKDESGVKGEHMMEQWGGAILNRRSGNAFLIFKYH